MVKQHRVLVVVGTRPEAVKLAPVVHELRRQKWADVRVLATAQHRHLLDQGLAFFDIRPDHDLDVMRPDQTPADLTARLLAGLEPVLAAELPALVLAQGDTTTVMATALGCFHRRILFGHVEAGLRTGDMHNPFPEEMHRVLVARLASLHFAPTEGARQNLLREGVAPATVHVTGNTGIDALLWTAARAAPSPFAPRAGEKLILVTAHRRENFGEPLAQVVEALRQIADRDGVRLLFPLHPNPRVREAARALAGHPSIELVEPLDYPGMVAAMRACTLILTDSGGVQEEAPSFAKPVLVLRTTTERPEGIAAGVARLVGTDCARIVAEVTRLLDDPAAAAAMTTVANPYGDGHASSRIVTALGAHLDSCS